MALEIISLKHPDTDVIVFEPDKKEALHFFQGPMSHQARNHIMMSAYHQTILQLVENFEDYQQIFLQHGIKTRKDDLKTDLISS